MTRAPSRVQRLSADLFDRQLSSAMETACRDLVLLVALKGVFSIVQELLGCLVRFGLPMENTLLTFQISTRRRGAVTRAGGTDERALSRNQRS